MRRAEREARNAERPSFVLCHWSFAAADGRESGFGGREPAQTGRPGNGQNPTALGTRQRGQAGRLWNCRSYLTPSTLRHNVASTTAAPGATRGSSPGRRSVLIAAAGNNRLARAMSAMGDKYHPPNSSSLPVSFSQWLGGGVLTCGGLQPRIPR